MTAPALTLVMTTLGLVRFTAAQLDEDVDLTISEVGVTPDEFVVAPTLTALPGEIRRIDTISGSQIGDNKVHLLVRDEAALSYTVRGFGLYLADGTLFAVYGQEDPIVEKSAQSTALLSIDIAFPTGDITDLTFGDTNFLNPPATTTTKGVVELATPVEAITGTDEERVVTPAALRAAIAAAIAVNDKIGTVKMWWGAAEDVAAGWAICNGQTIARSDGAGDITTPDLRGRVPVGVNDAHDLGDTFGDVEKTINTEDAGGHTPSGTLPDHDHNFEGTGATSNNATGATLSTTIYNLDAGSNSSGVGVITLNDPGHGHASTVTGTTAPASLALTMEPVPAHGHELTLDVTQPSIALHFIMRV